MYEKYLAQLEEAGKIRNLKERSITCYKNYVFYFLKYQNKDPEELTCQDVREFLLAKKNEGLKASTLNLYNSAIRFFYRNVLHILWDDITVPRMILEHKLPTVLTPDEVDRLLDAVDDIKYKAMFATMYSSGMRVSEVIHLHYDDISRSRMQIHVRDTKNRMDRYTILSKRCLDILTQYWFEKGRPRGILFPSRFTGDYLTVSTLEQVMRRAVSDAELRYLSLLKSFMDKILHFISKNAQTDMKHLRQYISVSVHGSFFVSSIKLSKQTYSYMSVYG